MCVFFFYFFFLFLSPPPTFTVCEKVTFNNCLVFARSTRLQFLYVLILDVHVAH